MSTRSAHLRLYIADLAKRQFDYETGRVPMQPVAYRVLAKRLRSALAGLPAARLRYGFAELDPHLQPLVHAALENRHFDEHGRLDAAPAAARLAELAEATIARARARAKVSRSAV